MVAEMDNKTWVDGGFGDDAGFLSWLWIDLWSEEPEEKEMAKKEEKKEKASKEDIYMEDDIKPEMTEAKVIKRTTVPKKKLQPKKKAPDSKTRNDVDDLIKRKSQTEQSAYSDIGWRKKKGGTRGNISFGKGKVPSSRHRWWKKWWSYKSPWRRTPWSRGSGAAIRVWATRRWWKQKNIVVEKREKIYKVSDDLKKKGTIQMDEVITVKEFSEKMWVPLPEVMKVLLANKIVAAAHAHIDYDTAVLVAVEFDVTVEKKSTKVSMEDIFEGNLQAILDQDHEAEDLAERPPIVTIMWHVDHGKTKLLDYLRKTDVTSGEAGGITQSIWASQIVRNNQKITFIDTPGHELFTAIRARGSKLTNIVVIVIAADDGVKPQTVEAIRHAKDAGVPIIVAITKIDLGTQKIEEIKGQLAQHELQPEDRWGDVMIVPCSSVTGQGIDDLLDAILLQYEMLELRYSPSRFAVGVVIEAYKDLKKGVLTTLLVMTGTLHVGDIVVTHNTFGKVKKMMDRTGKTITSSTGWDPVMIMWLQDLPEPGRVTEVVKSNKEAREKIEKIQEHQKSLAAESSVQSLADRIGKWDKVELKLIIKSDSFGSLEAIKHAALQVEMPETVALKIIHDSVWSITNSDIVFAKAADAFVIGFNVTASGAMKKKAKQENVTIKEYDIIYEFIEYLEQLSLGMVVVEKKEVFIGKLEVLWLFYRKGKEMIFGWKVLEGEMRNHSYFKIRRDGKEIEEDEELNEEEIEEINEEGTEEEGEKKVKKIKKPTIKGTVTSLQREQKSMKVVKEWHECGMKVKASKKIEVGDIVEYFVME